MEYQSFYAKLTPLLRTPDLEVEARFHVIINAYHHIRAYFEGQSRPVITESTDYRFGEIRVTVSEGRTFAVKKRELLAEYLTSFDVKLTASVEMPVAPRLDFKAADLTRKKRRLRFDYPENFVDLTVVQTTFRDNPRVFTSYEVEVEMKDPAGAKTEFQDLVKLVYMTAYDTEYAFPAHIRDTVINDFNRILGASPDSTHIVDQPANKTFLVLSHERLSNARDLQVADCVSGAIVGGKYQYTVTLKADGSRKLLMIHTSGLWLLYPPLDLNLIWPFTGKDRNVEILKKFNGTIIDGEEIRGETRLYLPFDLLAVTGVTKVQERPLSERLELARRYTQFPIPKTTIKFKEFIPFRSYAEFGAALRRLASSNPGYRTDGFVITPENSPYLFVEASGRTPLHKRNLRNIPDICKLKPWEQLTIDFIVEISVNGPKLITNETVTGQRDQRAIIRPVEYRGSFKHTFDIKTQLVTENAGIDLRTVASGTIVEFGPRKTPQGLALEPRRIRADKPRPNNKEIADAVWDDINDPLTLDTFEGRSFKLLFHHFNVVKAKLLGEIPAEADIIDLGSGRGGDLSKFRRFHHVLCVEPNPEHLSELRQRAEHLGITNVTPLQAKAEETKAIVTEAKRVFGWGSGSKRPTYVTMMLSLSFFFGSDANLEELARTLRYLTDAYGADLKFVALTIEGGRTEKLLTERQAVGSVGIVEMRLIPPNQVYIDIPGSIVKEQTEFLVDLDRLAEILRVPAFNVKPIPKETFMSEAEITFTSLFVSCSGTIDYNVIAVDAEGNTYYPLLRESTLKACLEALGLKTGEATQPADLARKVGYTLILWDETTLQTLETYPAEGPNLIFTQGTEVTYIGVRDAL